MSANKYLVIGTFRKRNGFLKKHGKQLWNANLGKILQTVHQMTKLKDRRFRNTTNWKRTWSGRQELISGKRPEADKPVQSADGRLLTTDSEQSERWSTYFETLLNKPPVASDQSPIDPVMTRTFNASTPAIAEIKSAIKRLTTQKWESTWCW